MDSVVLRAVGPILTAIGSIILAVRLEAILDAILKGMAAQQKALSGLVEGAETEDLRQSHEKVLKELGKGRKILLWGFALVAIGGIVNALSYFIN